MAVIIVKEPDQILNDALADYQSGMEGLGYLNTPIDPNTEIYTRFSSFANELAVASLNTQISFESALPSTATGSDLDDVCATYSVFRRNATTGSGFITLVSSLATTIVAGTQLVSTTGFLYQVVLTGIYSNGASIQVVSVDTGSLVNLDEGNVLTWVATPAFAQGTVVVFSEIAGGNDAEDDETLRSRLEGTLSNPPLYNNWQSVANLADNLDPVVRKSFIYSCYQGPGTQAIALAGYTTATDKTLNIPLSNLQNLTSSIIGSLPEFTFTSVSTVQNALMDVGIILDIPYPIGAPNLGIGGGWTNFSPYPITNVTGNAHNGTTNFAFCSVSAVVNSTTFTIKSPLGVAPSAGVSKISWVNKASGWIINTATIISYTGTGPYQVVIDQPFVNIAVNDHIFPASINQQIYLNTVLNSFSAFGPGDLTSITQVATRAKRKPLPQFKNFPNTADGTLLNAVIKSGSEVLDAQFACRRANLAQSSGSSQQTLLLPNSEFGTNPPNLPTNINYMPMVFIPNQISFYPIF